MSIWHAGRFVPVAITDGAESTTIALPASVVTALPDKAPLRVRVRTVGARENGAAYVDLDVLELELSLLLSP